MNNKSLHWLRGFTIPFVALLIVAGLVVYSAGFNNVLQFLGTKAATDDASQTTETANEEAQTNEVITDDQPEADTPANEETDQEDTPAVEEPTTGNDEDDNEASQEEPASTERSLMIMLDSSTNQALPLSFKIVAASDFGRTALLEETITSFTDSVVLDLNLAVGAYGLVVSAAGFVDQFIPFAVESGVSTIGIELATLTPSLMAAPNFDLNSDGAVNSLDLTVLLQEIGMR